MRINAGRVRRLWLVLLSLPLLMLMLAVPATPARAATAVNPFADLAGFTIYSSGDATLNNNELEGSVVAAHELSTSKQNYAVVHKVAGTGDYTIPVIDGVPVRMLANNYTIGASASAEPSFAVTNAGATTGTNEAQGSIKSVETSGWTAAERGGFVRVTPNAATPNFVIDLQSRAWSGTTSATEITRIKTQESSVAAYVSPDLTASTQCLASVVGNYVTVPAGDMAVLPALSTDRPNVFSYAELAGRTIKLDNNPGYQPTATAPIIVRVANGTTTIGKLNFEGWSSAAGAQQNYSSFILLDLSEVTNDVLIDGLEMGAIYAPQAEVTFNSNVTWNGQLIAGGFGAWGAGELHHHTFQPTLPCGSEPTTGRFAITKTVTGLNQGVDPGSFQFNYRIDQGANQTATVTPGTTWTSDQLPTGSVITITEVTPTPPAGHTFDNLTLGGDGVTVNNGTATLTIGNDTTTTVTALNTFTPIPATTGRFAITKTVTGLNQGVDPGNFQFNYRIDQGPNQTATVTPGTTWTSDQLPTGSVITITEVTPTPPAGHTFDNLTLGGDGVTVNNGTATLTIGNDTTTTVTALNTFTPIPATTGRFAITKTVTGLNQGVDPGSFQFNYRIDQGANQTATVTPGTTWTSDQLPTGSVITITEVTPTPPAGHTFDNLTLGGDGVTVNNGTATLTIGNDTTTTVTALNTFTPIPATTGRFAITKTVTGLNQGVDPGNFQFNYRIDQGPNQTATVTPGTTWTSDQLPTGSVITITEVTPTPPAGHTFQNLTLGGDGVTVNNGTATLTIGNDTTTTVTALNTYGVEDVTDVDDDSDNDGGDATDTEVDQLASTGPMGIVWFLLIAGVATAGGALLLRLRRRLG